MIIDLIWSKCIQVKNSQFKLKYYGKDKHTETYIHMSTWTLPHANMHQVILN